MSEIHSNFPIRSRMFLNSGKLLSETFTILLLRYLASMQSLISSGSPFSLPGLAAASNGEFHWQFLGASVTQSFLIQVATLSFTCFIKSGGIGYWRTQLSLASPV